MDKSKLDLIPRIKELYSKGDNLIDYLKKNDNRSFNSIEDILISYDFQSGSYINHVKANPQLNFNYTSALANVINELGTYNSILEVGVGEGTTLCNLIPKLKNQTDKIKFLGFDISWSRIYYAMKYFMANNRNAKLFIGDLFNVPLRDSAIDIVYTSHSIEPNGGREKEALMELYRITNKYLILLEPTSAFASEQGKKRMLEHGYIQNLLNTINELNLNLIEYKPFEISTNPLNPTGLYIIEKNPVQTESDSCDFFCPISHTPLREFEDHFFSRESLVSYPKIMNIPCLCSFYGILTSKHDE